MQLWKDYKVQIILMLLAILRIFAYFYPGYARDILFVLLQGILVITVIGLLLYNRNHDMHQKLYEGGTYGNNFTSKKHRKVFW